ncbi:MAG: hypothetical protein RR510_14650 [Morganella sp. (in: enterobacteria)]
MDEEKYRLYAEIIKLCRGYSEFTCHTAAAHLDVTANIAARYLSVITRIGSLVILRRKRVSSGNKIAVYAVADNAEHLLSEYYSHENKKYIPVYAGRKEKLKQEPARAKTKKPEVAPKPIKSDLPKIGGTVVDKAYFEPGFGRSFINHIDTMLREVRA